MDQVTHKEQYNCGLSCGNMIIERVNAEYLAQVICCGAAHKG